MTFKQALTKAKTVYIFVVVRQADGSDNSACGYAQVSKSEIRFQMRDGWMQRMEPEFTLNETGQLHIG